MPVAIHDLSEIDSPFASLIEKMQIGDEVIFTQQGREIARLLPIAQEDQALKAHRRTLIEGLQESVASKITPGPDAAHSQDFLYDEDGLPA